MTLAIIRPRPDATDTDPNNNIYNIVIRAIASRDSDDTGPAETVDTTVAVTVTDVDEDGKVVISWLQPEVGTAIMASLTDPDGPDPVYGTVDGLNECARHHSHSCS